MFETHSGGLENVSKVSPVLSMLLSADGLTGVAFEAARPLRLARDDQQPRVTRLDALGLFIKRLPKVMPDQRVLMALTTEALDLFEPPLNGARLTELRIGLSAREFHLSWDLLHCADWDLDGLQMKEIDHQARTLLDFAFRLPIRRFWEQPVSELLCDTEEAAATIRLMRLYVHLNVHPARALVFCRSPAPVRARDGAVAARRGGTASTANTASGPGRPVRPAPGQPV